MASLTPSATGFEAEGVTIRRVSSGEQRAALALLLTGRPRGNESAVEQFLSFAAQQAMSVDELWAAFRDGRPIAATLVVPSAGRTGMLFLSPPGSSGRDVEPELIRTACTAQDPRRMTLVQAILEDHETGESQTLIEGGFKPLAYLIYMKASVGRVRPVPDPEPPLELITWSERHRQLFADAILASYEQTLDCPGLLGLRHIDDIIAGHMAAGLFSPSTWTAVVERGKVLGVCLVNMASQRQAAELVYLGLVPQARGRGLGRWLLERAMAQAAAQHALHLLLAVDDTNTPAMRLYKSMHFAPTSRKLAMIYPLR